MRPSGNIVETAVSSMACITINFTRRTRLACRNGFYLKVTKDCVKGSQIKDTFCELADVIVAFRSSLSWIARRYLFFLVISYGFLVFMKPQRTVCLESGNSRSGFWCPIALGTAVDCTVPPAELSGNPKSLRGCTTTMSNNSQGSTMVLSQCSLKFLFLIIFLYVDISHS